MMFVKNKKGASEALGFIAVLMLMMLVVFNLMPPVLTLFDYMSLCHVQRDALLQMELAGGMTPNIYGEVVDKLENYNFNISNVTIDATPAPVDYGQDIEIQLSYGYTYEKYSFSAFSIIKSDEPKTMSCSARSVSLYFEK